MIVCLDTDCTIYLVEHHPIWGPKVLKRITDLRSAGDEIVVSDLARTECLAGPLHKGNAAGIADFQSFFSDPDIRLLPLTASVCERAAQLRAASNFVLKVPDCLHLAAAIEFGCGLFLTHDSQLTKCSAISVEILT
jgi:predicted nucleic acid-binding protein